MKQYDRRDDKDRRDNDRRYKGERSRSGSPSYYKRQDDRRVNFRDPAANLVDDPVINPPLDAEKDEENEERVEDIRGNLEEAMERAAFQASEWTRNVVGRVNIAVSSSVKDGHERSNVKAMHACVRDS